AARHRFGFRPTEGLGPGGYFRHAGRPHASSRFSPGCSVRFENNSVTPQLSQELMNAAQALGILTPGGGLNGDWFSDPSKSLQTILSNKDQRKGFLGLLDDLLPPENVDGAPAGEKWHPILEPNAKGNLYLTAKNGSSPDVVFGLAGLIKGSVS